MRGYPQTQDILSVCAFSSCMSYPFAHIIRSRSRTTAPGTPMTKPFLISIRLADSDSLTVRSAYAGSRTWFAMIDLFSVVVQHASPTQWPRPVRPPVPLIVRVCKKPANEMIQTVGELGVSESGIGKTCQYIAAEFAPEFMRLSGASGELSALVVKDLIDAVEAYKAQIPEAETPEQTSAPDEIAVLTKDLAGLERVVRHLMSRVSQIEAEQRDKNRQIDARLSSIEDHLQSKSSRQLTAEEFLKEANRFYAKAKAMQQEGR